MASRTPSKTKTSYSHAIVKLVKVQVPVPTAVPSLSTPTKSDQGRHRADLSVYRELSGRLRAKRSEMYEADRRMTLRDSEALAMAVEVEKLKRVSDKVRLSVCEQLRALIDVIHQQSLDSTQEVDCSSSTEARPSLELAGQFSELLHALTVTAIKEEIFESERLRSNGRSAVYVFMRNRWRVRPRSW